jgi:uncharacterized membrane protein
MIVESIEIARGPEDVFTYLDQLDRHGEWQDEVTDVKLVQEGPTRVGTRATETRNVPGGPRDVTYEVTEHDPPRTTSFRGIDGPVRVVGTVTVDPVDDGSHSRVTVELDFKGHGFGKLITPLVRREARKQVPKNQAALKERLESGV